MNGILPKPVNTVQPFTAPARQLMPQPEDLSGQCHVRGNLFEVQPDVQAGAILHESPLAANIPARGAFLQGLSRLRAKIFGGSNEQKHWRDLPSLDYEQLTIGKELKGRSKPIIFYHPLYEGIIPGIAPWIQSMRMLGIPLLYVNFEHNFKEEVEEHQPDIILYSALAKTIYEVRRAFIWSKENDPGAVSVIGGFGAVPEFANHMDYVVRGDGEITGPVLIKLLMGAIAEGGGDAARPSLLGGTVRSLSVTRSLASEDGGVFPINVPLGGHILMKEEGRIVAGVVASARERYQRDRGRWAAVHSGSRFPLTARQYAISTEPSLLNSKEISRLYLNPPPDDGRTIAVYTQRGCVGLCNFCSIRGGYNGPRPEVAQLESFVYYMSRRWRSRREFMFCDDLFIQDEAWVRKLLKKIRRFNFEFVFGTRVDRAPKDIVAMIKEMDGSLHFGLETLLPYRAEKMGKVGEGRGEEYIGKAIDTIDLLARLALEKRISGKESPERIVGDDFYIILASYGDAVKDVIAEIRADLEVMKYMWERYRYIVPFSYNEGERPLLGNHKTALLAGFPYSQPGEIDYTGYNDVQKMISMQLGDVEGQFHVFDDRDNGNGSHRLSGIFEPKEYVWPEEMKAIRDNLSRDGHPFAAIQSIYEAVLGLEGDIPKADLERIGELIEYLEKDEAFLRSDVGK